MRKRKKLVKLRGSKTHGYGSKKKHRGAGSRGGRGFSGSKKQRKSWIIKYKRNHLGKKGFKSLQQRGILKKLKSINIGDLLKLSNDNDIDASKLGYQKILGKGKVNRKVKVTAGYISSIAAKKIENAGGEAISEKVVESDEVVKEVEELEETKQES